MILPVYAYGSPILRKKGKEVDKDEPGLQAFIDNMFETMYEANGVGLAAQQVGKPWRIFIVDASPFGEDEGYEHLADFKKVFINPKIVEREGDEWEFNEGCLSFPELRFNVWREDKVRIQYYDRDFNVHDETYDGVAGRIIQHEYDHIEGVLFIDRIPALKRRMMKKKLNVITKGMVKTSYKMKYAKAR